jgi:hypothetical protein
MTSAFTHPLTIGRVRVQLSQATRDVQHWHWRTQRALNRVSLNPTGLPPQAILIVRQLPDLRPGQLLEEASWHTVNQWSGALETWLDDRWRGAFRPIHEPVPANANIIWFADRAEWLACLSWDIFTGVAMQRWWWKTWLKTNFYTDAGNLLYRLWQNEAQALPQTLTLLIRQHGIAVAVLLNQITAQQITALHYAVADHYQLPVDIAPLRLIDRLTPLLSSANQNVVSSLSAEAAGLLVLNLTIAQLPTITHIMRHQITADAVDDIMPLRSDTPPFASTTHPMKSDTVSNTRFESSSAAAQTQTAASTMQTPIQTTTANAANILAEDDEFLNSHPVNQSLDLPSNDEASIPSEDVPTAVDNLLPALEVSTPPDSSLSSVAKDDVEQFMSEALRGIRTELGGIWYLVNVLVDLNWLYHPDYSDVNPWHKLTVLATNLLGEHDNSDDVVWRILSELAQDELPQQIAANWIREALPVVQKYLDTRLNQQTVLLDALREPALLYVTRTHLDVVFKLDQIRLELRLVRLDRNPGWVPEFARVIILYYE